MRWLPLILLLISLIYMTGRFFILPSDIRIGAPDFAVTIDRDVTNIENKLRLPLFADTWQQRKLSRESALLHPLSLVKDQAVDQRINPILFDTSLQDIFLLVILWLILDAAFFTDKRFLAHDFLNVTYLGRKRLFWQKAAIAFCLLAKAFILFALSSIIFASASSLPLQVPIQMVDGYNEVLLPYTALSFFLFTHFVKFLIFLVCGFVFVGLTFRYKKQATALTVLSGILGIFWLAFIYSAPDGKWSFLRVINPIAFLTPAKTLNSRTFENIFGLPVIFSDMIFPILVLLLVFSLAFSYKAYGRDQLVRHSARKFGGKRYSGGYSKQLIKIILYGHKSALIVIILIGIMGYFTFTFINTPRLIDRHPLQHAILYYGGEMTPDNLERIQVRQATEHELRVTLMELTSSTSISQEDQATLNNIRQQLSTLPAAEGFADLLVELERRQDDGQSWLIEVRGFNWLFGVHVDGVHQRDFILSALCLVFFIVQAFAPMFSGKRHDVIRVTRYGRGHFCLMLHLIIMVAAFIFTLIPELARMISINASFPLRFWQAPIQELTNVVPQFSILGFWLFRIGATVLLFVVLASIVSFVLLKAGRELAIACGIATVLLIWLTRQLHINALSVFNLLSASALHHWSASRIQIILLFVTYGFMALLIGRIMIMEEKG